MTRTLRALLPLPLIAAALVTAPVAVAAPEANLSKAAPRFDVMTPASTVASRTDRRPMAGAVYDKVTDQTITTWSGQHAHNYVQAYDHKKKTWTAPRQIADGESDPHNYPTIVQADDGYLLVFQGMHNKSLRLTRSPKPRSVEGDWTQHTIAEGAAASYPMPFKTANGTIYVFFRETSQELDPSKPTDFRPMRYVVSTDNGRSWRNSEQLTGQRFAIGSTSRADHMDEIYIGQLRYEPASLGNRERVHIVYTLAGGGPEGHKHDRYHRNIYYAWFDPANRHFYSASGRDLGTQIDDADQEQRLKIVETPLALPGGIKSPDYIQQVGVANGKPFTLWFETDNTGLWHNRAAVFEGGRWVVTEVATGYRTREIERLDGNTWRVYATRDAKPDIETFLLRGGKHWSPETVIRTPKPVQRVEVVTGFRDPARIIATGASSDRNVAVADGDIYVAGLPPARCRLELPILGCVLRKS
ncbi:BNR-4 repeat-containing protein [Crossiella sp. CA-258035]|uniref:BNR-4 repeat-containing protein n=1 Tax=Crossiella sp. CA-258035 TaxID=2981138 RepID=UPI0024BC089B|nr:BNR-4 repeat-containing protein [Crossiella sp. CA-258035]WHT19707.1 BNR-4 repeat-containing protein [Crossiella sp. CA-258035]